MAGGGQPAGPEHAHTAHKRHINQLIFESLSSKDGEIAFFCECPSEECFESVWMGLEDYERARVNPRWSLIRAGHQRPARMSSTAGEPFQEAVV